MSKTKAELWKELEEVTEENTVLRGKRRAHQAELDQLNAALEQRKDDIAYWSDRFYDSRNEFDKLLADFQASETKNQELTAQVNTTHAHYQEQQKRAEEMKRQAERWERYGKLREKWLYDLSERHNDLKEKYAFLAWALAQPDPRVAIMEILTLAAAEEAEFDEVANH